MHLLSLGVAALLARCTVAAAGDASIRYHEVARKSNESLLWGPYRPNLYFGVRPRIPKSLMGGLMWSRVDNYQDVQTSKLGGMLQVLETWVGGHWHCARCSHWDRDLD